MESALLKVHNDISLNKDTGKVTTLTLLELSQAFDTIYYSDLLDCLSNCYCISGTALTWVRPFWINKSHLIKIINRFSEAVLMFCGVPQGSVLGPLLLIPYKIPLSSYPQPQLRLSFICSWHPSIHIFINNIYRSFSHTAMWMSRPVISLAGWKQIDLIQTKQISLL